MNEGFDIGETPIDDTPIPIERVGVSVPLWQARFLLPLDVTPLDDGVNWRVNGAFIFESQVLNRIIAIPDGFITDFASVPRFLWETLPPWGKYGRGSVVHDYLYRTPGQASKDDADHVFLECMIVGGVSAVIRDVMFEGVHKFGGSSYKGGL